MYLSYYGLNEKPFQISADPRFLWLGEKHKEAFAVLQYGIMDNKGFLLLTGDVGAGKTTLIHALMNGIDENVICATVPDPGLNKIELFNYIAHAFKIGKKFNNKVEFLIIFREFLNKACDEGKKVLLIVDESQRLTQELLEEIRLLSNIERQNTKLLNIFFVGQVEFNSILLEERNKAVRQRITVTNHVRPLSEPETAEYIKHRLKIAGRTKKLFAPSAIREIHSFSKGYPRLINIISDISLLTGYVREVKEIDKKIVLESYDSLQIKEHHPVSEERTGAGRQSTVASGSFADDAGADRKPFEEAESYLSYPVIVNTNTSIWKILGFTFLSLILVFLIVSVGYLLHGNYMERDMRVYRGTQASATVPSHVAEKSEPDISKKTEVQAQAVNDLESSADQTVEDVETETGIDKKAGVASRPQTSAEAATTDPAISNKPDNALKLFPITSNRLIIDFSHNSNDFTETAYQKLDSLAIYMVEKPEKHVVIKGYTDSNGDYSYNKSLSVFRANIVKSYLIGKGVPIARIVSVGMGAENPVGDNNNVQGRRANRRVEIEILESDF